MTLRSLAISQHGNNATKLLDVRENDTILERFEFLADISDAYVQMKKKKYHSSEKALEMVREKIRK